MAQYYRGISGSQVVYWNSEQTAPIGVTNIVTVANAVFTNEERVWTDENDGTGSGLDADLLDGLDSSALSGGGANGRWTEGSPSPRIRTTASVAIGTDGLFAQQKGADLYFYVSGTIGLTGSAARKALFGGDVVTSGSLQALQFNSDSTNTINNNTNTLVAASSLITASGNDTSVVHGTESTFTNNFGSLLNGIYGTNIDSTYNIVASLEESSIQVADTGLLVGALVEVENSGGVYVLGSVHTVSKSNNSTIIGGKFNTIRNTNAGLSSYNNIIGGLNHIISSSINSNIIGGENNTIQGTIVTSVFLNKENSIISSTSSLIYNSDYSSIIHGHNSIISQSKFSAHFGSISSSIINSTSSYIIGNNSSSLIANAKNAIILGGFNNQISGTSPTNIWMLGTNLTSSQNNTIYLGGTNMSTIVFGGLSGSLQKTSAGLQYLVSSPSLTLVTNSNGQVIITLLTGSGSGLDADTLDGIQGADYTRADLTFLGRTGNQTLDTVTNTAAEWSALPVGYSRMFSTTIGISGGAPQDKYGYFTKIANRDNEGGWGGLWTKFQADSAAHNYIGYSITNSSFATWEKIWTDVNDGPGSGLDADTVDGFQASNLVQIANTQTITGDKTFSGGLTGSLLRTAGGNPYLKAGPNITLFTNSLGQVEITGSVPAPTNATYVVVSGDGTLTNERTLTAGSGITIVDGGPNANITINANVSGTFIEGSPSPRLRTTASVAIGSDALFAEQKGTDLYFYVSGTVGIDGSTADKSLFGGDVVISGSLIAKQINSNNTTNAIGSNNTETTLISLKNSTISNNRNSLIGGVTQSANSNNTILVFGNNVEILNSTTSFILSDTSIISNSFDSSIIGAGQSTIKDSFYSSIFGSYFSIITKSLVSTIVGGFGNAISNSVFGVPNNNIILGGEFGATLNSFNSALFNVTRSGITESLRSNIFGSRNSYIINATNSHILFADDQNINGISNRIIIGDSTKTINVSGSTTFNNGLTGSLLKTATGLDYLVAGTNIILVTNSNGQVIITGSGGSNGTWVEGSPSPRLRTTASAAVGSDALFAEQKGADLYFYVSGTRAQFETSNKKALFGGDVVMSGALVAEQFNSSPATNTVSNNNTETAVVATRNSTIERNRNTLVVGTGHTADSNINGLVIGENLFLSGNTSSYAIGDASTVLNSRFSTLIGGNSNFINTSFYGNMVGSLSNTIANSILVNTIGGSNNRIENTINALILLGTRNNIFHYNNVTNSNAVIVGSRDSVISSSVDATLINVSGSGITTSFKSTIIGSSNSYIINSTNSHILYADSQTINTLNNAIIIGDSTKKFNISSSQINFLFGPSKFHAGLSGSLQKTTTGLDYLVAGPNITLVTNSNGQVLISGSGLPSAAASYVVVSLDGTLTNERALTAGSGIQLIDGGANGNITINSTVSGTWIEGSPSPRLRTTASVAIGSDALFAQQKGADLNFYVSGAVGGTTNHALFGGDLAVSGNLTVGGNNNSVLIINPQNSGAGEGAEIRMMAANTASFAGGALNLDILSDRFRLFENGGTNRGAFLDIDELGAAASSKIWHSTNDGVGSGLDADLLKGFGFATVGNNWGAIAAIGNDGVMEIGRYLDFHNSDTSSADFDVRLDTNNTTTDLYINSNKIWHQGNDGAGSALDADLLDGQQGSFYLDTSATTQTKAGNLTLSGLLTANGAINRNTANGTAYWLQQDGTARQSWYWNTAGGTSPVFLTGSEDASAISMTVNNGGSGGNVFFRSASGVGQTASSPITWTTTLFVDLFSITYKGNTVWHAGNDGAGSGLDADLLDGLNSSTSATANTIVARDGGAGVSASVFYATSNGLGQNYKIGDDAWIGDVNVANTIMIKGAQNSNQGYAIFGDADTTKLGRSGSGPLTYGGNIIWHQGNDGAGSGLDADLLDGFDQTYFLNTTSTAQTKLGTLIINRSNVADATQDFRVLNSTYTLNSHARLSAGQWSALTSQDTSGLIFTAGSQNTGRLLIGPWTSASIGLVITSSGDSFMAAESFALRNLNNINKLYVKNNGHIEVSGNLYAYSFNSSESSVISSANEETAILALKNSQIRTSKNSVFAGRTLDSLSNDTVFIFGANSSILGSATSFLAGDSSAISGSVFSGIWGGGQNIITDSSLSNIHGAYFGRVRTSVLSNHFGGFQNIITNAALGAPHINNILGGQQTSILNSAESTIINSKHSGITNSANSTIFGTSASYIFGSTNSHILFADNQIISNLNNRILLGDSTKNINISSSQINFWNGPALFNGGLSGSLQKLVNGLDYLIAGPNISLFTNSNGQIEISASASGSSTLNNWKESVQVATTANIVLSGTQSIDGVALTGGERVLVKNQSSSTQNGIYLVSAGAWSRSSDADQTSDFVNNATVYVITGNTNARTYWASAFAQPFTLDSSNLLWDSAITAGSITDLNVTTAKIADNAVSNTKFRQSTGLTVVGRASNTVGNVADISATIDGQVLRRSGTTLGFGQIGNAALASYSVDYVSNIINADYKNAVRVATTANITLSGTQSIDGILVTAGQRVLVKDQLTASANGIYVCQAGAWSRSSDHNSGGNTVNQAQIVSVQTGSVNKFRQYQLTSTSSISIGTTPLIYSELPDSGGPVIASATRAAAQSISNNTETIVNLDTIEFNLGRTDLALTVDLSGDVITINKDGYYEVSVSSRFPVSAGALCYITATIGTVTYHVSAMSVTSGGNHLILHASRKMFISAGTNIALRIFQNSGVAMNTDTSPDGVPRLQIALIR